MIHTCNQCGHRETVKVIFANLTTPKKRRKGLFQSTQQLIPPKPYGRVRGVIWDFMSWTSFIFDDYKHKEPDEIVQHEFHHYTDNRLNKIKYPNISLSPRLLEQLAKCYTGNLAKEWSKTTTKQYCRGIGGTKHDNIKNEFLEAELLKCTRGEGRGCTEYKLTKEGEEFLRKFL